MFLLDIILILDIIIFGKEALLMNSYAEKIRTIIMNKPENMPLIAREVYNFECSEIPEATFYKSLERMCSKGELIHLTKGTYYRPKKGRFGAVPISTDEIVGYYTNNGQGVALGYRLYNRKGLTTQIGKKEYILTSSITESRKQIENVVIEKINIDLTPEIIATIEMMETLQNYSKIEDINKNAFVKYAEDYSNNYFNDEIIEHVLEKRKYKKSTIAFLKSLLDAMGIENKLSEYLSPLSTYAIPSMEELYETA